jgi:hypothetical protein
MKLITIMGIEIRTKESDMPGKGDSFGVCVPHQLKKGWMKVLWRWTTPIILNLHNSTPLSYLSLSLFHQSTFVFFTLIYQLRSV